jgi:hypothetical protein
MNEEYEGYYNAQRNNVFFNAPMVESALSKMISDLQTAF